MSITKKAYWKIATKHYNLQKSLHELKSIGIEITNRCNLNCRHCYMNSSCTQDADFVNTAEWIRFFNILKKDFGNNITIQITGGEPLVRKDLFVILKHLKKLGFKITLVTNGLLLNENNLKLLKNLLSSLSISLDGFSESHNTIRNSKVYDTVLSNIKIAVKLEYNFLIIKTTIFKNNLKELDNFYNFVNELGVSEWHLFAMEPIGRGNDNHNQILSIKEYKELCNFVDRIKRDKNKKIKIKFEEEGSGFMHEKTCDLYKHKLCNAGISSCAILHNGDIVNCIQDDRKKLEIHGNIKRDDFAEIWKSKFSNNRHKDYRFCNNHYFLNKISNYEKIVF